VRVTITDERRQAEVSVPAPAASEWTHVAGLDGLRAAAVIAVLLFHAGHLQGGFLGVDLFFALSGFLITSLLIRDSESGGVNLVQFWGRRFRRLLPAVFVMILLVALWSWLFGTPADLDGVKSDGIFGLVYFANWHFIADSGGYWTSFAQPSMFDHLWSLAIEEQFYVIWPLVILAIWTFSRRPHRTLLIVAVAGVVASFTAMLLLYDGGDPTRVYMGTDTRAASLLMGVIAATPPVRAFARRVADRLGGRLGIVIAVIAAAILWSWFAIDGASSSSLYRGGLLLHSLACATLVGLLVAARPGRVVNGFGWAPLAWIGMLSYGLYLWHWPLYVILSPERMGFDGAGLTVVRIAASFVAAYISFKIVEDPLRRRVPWVRGRPGLVVFVASIAGLIAFLIVLPDPETEIAAFDPASVAAATTVPEPAPQQQAPAESEVEPADTSVPAVVAPPVTEPVARGSVSTVIWGGDSVAFDLAPAVGAAFTGAGVTVVPKASYPGIRLLGSNENLRLAGRVDEILTQQPADTVMIPVSTWDADESDEDYAAGLRELADLLPPDGRLIVLSSPPTGEESVNADLDRLAGVAMETAAGSDGRIVFIDTGAAWVSPPVLDSNGDGAPERKRDLIHVCPAGAANFAAWLTTELDARFDGLEPVDPTTWASGEWVTDPRYDQPVGACAPV
jgi:peptidoglycan/LPS O-acetylase OafA/YrhL